MCPVQVTQAKLLSLSGDVIMKQVSRVENDCYTSHRRGKQLDVVEAMSNLGSD